MDPRRKQLLIGIGMVAVALIGWYLVVQAIRMYTPQNLQANVSSISENNEQDEATSNLASETMPNQQQPVEQSSQLLEEVNLAKETEKLPTLSRITIIVPMRVDTVQFRELTKRIAQEYHVQATVRTAKTLTDYKNILHALVQHPQQADIVLVPTNRIDSFTDWWYRIPFKQSISPLFDPIFRTRIDHQAFTYLPYLIDPMVTLYNTQSYTPKWKTTFSDLQSALLTPRKTTSSYLPLLFGIDAGDLALLEQENAAYPGYIELLELFVSMDLSRNTTTLLDFFLQTSHRNTTRFHALSHTLGERVDSCQYWPHLCLLAYDIADIWFGWLHELSQLEGNFPHARAQIAYSNIPTLDQTYPVTGWWWVVSKQSTDMPATLTWIKWYLELLVDEEPVLHDYAFSASSAIYQRQKIEDRYLPLAWFAHQYKLVIGSLTDSHELLQNSSLIPMLRGEYSKGIFLKSMNQK